MVIDETWSECVSRIDVVMADPIVKAHCQGGSEPSVWTAAGWWVKHLNRSSGTMTFHAMYVDRSSEDGN